MIIAALCHFHISLTAAILGVTLISEVCVLFALAFSVIFKGGGPDGLMLNQTVLLNNAFESLPAGAFGTAAAAGSMAIGLFFAFWSWVGFETTAVYGEESRNPKKIVPRATLIAVIGLGLFYTFISAMVLAGNGAKTSVETSISASPLDLFFGLVEVQPRRRAARHLQDPARHRIVRLRAGVPQRSVALPLRARSRNPFQRSA